MTADTTIFRMVRERGAVPFAWGASDCAMWALDVARALTGRDCAADIRGAYSDAATALQQLRRVGGLRALAGRVGPEVQAPADGDVALMDRSFCVGEGRELGAMGVAWRGMVVVQTDKGLGYLPLAAAVAFWRPQA